MSDFPVVPALNLATRLPGVISRSNRAVAESRDPSPKSGNENTLSIWHSGVPESSLVFDEGFYFEKNPQLRDLVSSRQFLDGESHWKTEGGRFQLAHRFVDPETMDSRMYFAAYPEAESSVRRGQFESAGQHWVMYGRLAGFRFFPTERKSTRLVEKRRQRIVFLAATDFANTMTRWAKAIRQYSRRIEAFSICLRPHSFQYADPHDLDLSDRIQGPGRTASWCELVTPDRVTVARELLASADLIVQSDELAPHGVLDLFAQLTGLDLSSFRANRVIIRHSGSNFRSDHARRNQCDRSCRGQIVHPDLLRLARSSARPAFAVVERVPSQDEIAARFSQSRLVIIHTPSRKSTKGSDAIRRVVERVIRAMPQRGIDYQEIFNVPNSVIKQRKRGAHIHIDQFNADGQDGIGGFGSSSCEGWEQGNIVLCSVNNIHPRAWQAWNIDSRNLPLVDIGTNETVFYERLYELCSMGLPGLVSLATQQSRDAYQAFGPRKVTKFFEDLVGEAQSPLRTQRVQRRDRRPVFVCGQWSSPAALHKLRYFALLAEAFGARVLYVDSDEQLAERVMSLRPSMVITANFPMYHVYTDRWIHELPKSVPLVSWHDDLRRQMHRQLPRVLDRSDAVISVLKEAVLRPDQFPTIGDKLWRLPWFIPSQLAPYQLNCQPVMKCLLPGAIKASRPLRQRAVKEIAKHHFERLEHPGYGRATYTGAVVGEAFYDFLHRFACVLTDGGIYRYTVAKYFEIPYTGALMLADPVPDLDELGFRSGQHFVSVTDTTPLGPLVEDILTNFGDYEDIRLAGRELVMRQHTEETRRQEAAQMAFQIMDQFNLRICHTSQGNRRANHD